MQINPLAVPSLKEACVQQLEDWILSGELKIGEKLPPERKLAERLNISRPVLHEALVDLAAKGLVRIEARRGVFVSDYRTNGSCALLSSLLSFHQGALDPAFEDSLIEMRHLFEVETARLAAMRRSEEDLEVFDRILKEEMETVPEDVETLVQLDFNFHLQIALASGNTMYPLILNSFQSIYTHLTRRFFSKYQASSVIDTVFAFHQELATAIRAMDAESAGNIMAVMLQHGEQFLRGGRR